LMFQPALVSRTCNDRLTLTADRALLP
jgi:hypothetical protein